MSIVKDGFLKECFFIISTFSAGNADALLHYVAGLDDVSLVSESELSSDKIVIAFSAARTHYSSIVA